MEQLYDFTSNSTVNTASGLVSLVMGVIYLIGMAKLFGKAGKSKILAVIPIVNLFVLTGIVTGKPVKALWSIIPIANIVFMIKLHLGVAKTFGYDKTMGILTIFFSPITFMIMGTGDHEYQPQFTQE